MLYENSILGVNEVAQTSSGIAVDFFDFTNADTESYNYDRAARYSEVKVGYYTNTDADPDLEYQEGFVFDVVFGNQNWSDDYIALGPDGETFIAVDASGSGANDFAQAADDARAVILFLHDSGGFEIV